MDEKIKCECGNEWKISNQLAAYKGEVVLYCENCGEAYYNAQEFFSNESLENLERV